MNETEISPRQLDRIIERATKFLSAASQVPSIRGQLDQGGYNEEEHRTGWNLLLELLGYRAVPDSASPLLMRQREAAAAIDQWDGPTFERARAALDHRFPAQGAYVFEGLSAKVGPESIGAARTFLDRVAALRDGTDPARAATREQDAQAAALLAARRIVDQAEEARVRALIEEATRLADLPTAAEPDPSRRQETARKLDAWLRDWRGTARVLITRRDRQIRLGLAERRNGRSDEGEGTAGLEAEEPAQEYAES